MSTQLIGSAALQDGRVAWVVWRDLPLHLPQFPNQLPTNVVQFANGREPQDSHLQQVRMLTWGLMSVKTFVFFEAPVTVERDPVNW